MLVPRLFLVILRVFYIMARESLIIGGPIPFLINVPNFLRNLLRTAIVKFINGGLSFSPFYFSLLFSFHFIFLFSIFRTTKARVKT